MKWQDIVMGAAQVGIALGLIAAMASPEKPPIEASIMQFVALAFIAVALSSLRLWFSAAMAYLCASQWMVLILQVAFR